MKPLQLLERWWCCCLAKKTTGWSFSNLYGLK